MCFSPEGDLVGGLAIVTIGIDACRHLDGRREYLFVAAMPVLLGLHQIDETFVWWGLQGHVPAAVGTVAMWIYLVFALVVLPVLLPLLVRSIEQTPAMKRRITPFVCLGAITGVYLLLALIRNPPIAHLGAYHLGYSFGLRHGASVVVVYAFATCGAMIFSKMRHVVWFGLFNVVAVLVLARLCADGFASLWCFYAALASGGVAVFLRFSSPESLGASKPQPAIAS